MTREAVIVSTARTPIGKAYRGAFNDTDAPSLGGHAIAHAVKRAGIEPGEVDDVIIEANNHPGPVLIDFQVETEGNVWPMVPAGAALSETVETSDQVKAL